MNHHNLKLRTPYQAPYGLSAEAAAEEAVKFAIKWMKATPRLTDMTFDFHGFYQHLDVNSDPAKLAAGIHERHKELAALYAAAPVPDDAVEREQGCKLNEALHDGVLPAIQCGQRWGEEALMSVNDYERLRHVFVWEHIRIPFNPWAPDEHVRVEAAVEQLLLNPTPEVLKQKHINELVSALPTTKLGLHQELARWILSFLEAYVPGQTVVNVQRVQYEFHDHAYEPLDISKVPKDSAVAVLQNSESLSTHLAGMFLTYLTAPADVSGTELKLIAEFAATKP